MNAAIAIAADATTKVNPGVSSESPELSKALAVSISMILVDVKGDEEYSPVELYFNALKETV
jgi:hypothetical protein